MYLSKPPRIKILEALGAVSDGRIHVIDEHRARVVSSEGDKEYDVYVDWEQGIAYSNDNGTKFRGYVGYPIIAMLMLQGRLPFDKRLADSLKGIPWKKLNEKYKKYWIVEKIVKNIASKKGVKPEEIDAFINMVMNKLAKRKLRLVEPPG